ncbi:MAG: lytic transglycosylase domain-containing protein [Pseudomonadota bacterium]
MPSIKEKEFSKKLTLSTAIAWSLCTSVGLAAQSGIYSESTNGQVIAAEGGVYEYSPPSELNDTDDDYEPIEGPVKIQALGYAPLQNSLVAGRIEGQRVPPSEHKRESSAASARGLPMPQTLANVRPHQRQMYELAVKVAEQYSVRREVSEAGVSRGEFVTMFTTLIQRESNFEPTAVSSAGARGLGQLMPGTARELGVEDSFSPTDNLDGSARYLVEMLGKFGKPEYALAAYNAGPGNVSKYGGIPPFDETRQYVSDILHNTASRLR